MSDITKRELAEHIIDALDDNSDKNLALNEIKEFIKELFDSLDKDGSDSIDKEEAQEVGILYQQFLLIDKDQSGEINLNEFTNHITGQFDDIARDDGKIDAGELMEIFKDDLDSPGKSLNDLFVDKYKAFGYVLLKAVHTKDRNIDSISNIKGKTVEQL